MSDLDLSQNDIRVLAALKSGFPASQSPYCDLGAELGISEIDVLDSAGKLRETGAIARIVVVFPDIDAVLGGTSREAADLAQLVAFDLPWSEHPYDELAAQLQMRGVEIDEAGVLDIVREWLVDGTASQIVALSE